MLNVLKILFVLLPAASLVLMLPLVLWDELVARRAKSPHPAPVPSAAIGLLAGLLPASAQGVAQSASSEATAPAMEAVATLVEVPAAAFQVAASLPAAAGRRTLSAPRMRPVSMRTRSNPAQLPISSAP